MSKLISGLTGRYDEFAKDKFSTEISRLRRHIQASSIHEEEVKSWSPLLVVQFIVGMSQCQTYVGSRLVVTEVFLYFKYSQTIISRSKMSQLRLNGKATVFIENQFANKLNFH